MKLTLYFSMPKPWVRSSILSRLVEDDRHLVAPLHIELGHAELGCARGEKDRDLVAVALHAAVLGEVLHRIRELIEAVDLARLDLVALDDDEIVRFRVRRVVRQELDLVACDVEELLVLGVERPDRQVAILGELAAHDEPFAVRLPGLRHAGVEVPGLVMAVDAVEHDLDVLVALECLDGGVDIPFDHLAVEEQRRVGIAFAVERGVQRPQADLRFGHHGFTRILDLAVEPFEDQ